MKSGLRLPGWTGTGRSRLDRDRPQPVGGQSAERSWSGASPHVSYGKQQADCGRLKVNNDNAGEGGDARYEPE